MNKIDQAAQDQEDQQSMIESQADREIHANIVKNPVTVKDFFYMEEEAERWVIFAATGPNRQSQCEISAVDKRYCGAEEEARRILVTCRTAAIAYYAERTHGGKT